MIGQTIAPLQLPNIAYLILVAAIFLLLLCIRPPVVSIFVHHGRARLTAHSGLVVLGGCRGGSCRGCRGGATTDRLFRVCGTLQEERRLPCQQGMARRLLDRFIHQGGQIPREKHGVSRGVARLSSTETRVKICRRACTITNHTIKVRRNSTAEREREREKDGRRDAHQCIVTTRPECICNVTCMAQSEV